MAMNRQTKRMLQKQGQLGADGEPVAQKRKPPPAAKNREKRVGPLQFLREVRGELRKVAWPTRDEVVKYSIVVLRDGRVPDRPDLRPGLRLRRVCPQIAQRGLMTLTSDTEPTDGADDAVSDDATAVDVVTDPAAPEAAVPEAAAAEEEAVADPAALLGERGSESFETEADHAHSDILNEPAVANPLDALGGLGDHKIEPEAEVADEVDEARPGGRRGPDRGRPPGRGRGRPAGREPL